MNFRKMIKKTELLYDIQLFLEYYWSLIWKTLSIIIMILVIMILKKGV